MSRTTVERRTHARIPSRFEIEAGAGEGGTQARMVSHDLSLGGLQCSSSRDYAEMTRVAVRLLLPTESDPEPVDVEAVVVRRREVPAASGNARFELALFFTSMSDVCRERIARYLERHSRD